MSVEVENVSFYGGPRHGDVRTIPAGKDDLPMEILLTQEREKGTRSGHYTRVHDNGGRPTSEFEWAGYTTPFVPLPA